MGGTSEGGLYVDRARAVVRRRNAFDALRLMAALAVVVQHSVNHLDGQFLWFTPYSPWWFYDGVPAFFILSGYFVYRAADVAADQAHGVWTFVRNRALRIAPAIWAYALVMLVGLVATGWVTAGQLASLPGVLWVATMFGLAPVYTPPFLDGYGVGALNGSLWTIPVELSFYALLTACIPLRRRVGWPAVLVLLAALAVAGVAADAALAGAGVGRILGLTFLPHLGLFTLGVAWFWLAPLWLPRWWHAALALAAYVLSAGFISPAWEGVPPSWATLVSAVPLSIILMWLGFALPGWVSGLTRRVGDLSFGVYVWHMPVVNALLASGVTLPAPLLPWLVLAASLLLAAASWRWVERPALSLKRRASRRV